MCATARPKHMCIHGAGVNCQHDIVYTECVLNLEQDVTIFRTHASCTSTLHNYIVNQVWVEYHHVGTRWHKLHLVKGS